MKDKLHWRGLCEQAAYEEDPDCFVEFFNGRQVPHTRIVSLKRIPNASCERAHAESREKHHSHQRSTSHVAS